MPKVGNKEYPYTEEGMAAAETASEQSGEPVMRTYDAGGRVARLKGLQEGPRLDRGGIGYTEEGPPDRVMDKEGDIIDYADMNEDGKIDISDIVIAREKIAKFNEGQESKNTRYDEMMKSMQEKSPGKPEPMPMKYEDGGKVKAKKKEDKGGFKGLTEEEKAFLKRANIKAPDVKGTLKDFGKAAKKVGKTAKKVGKKGVELGKKGIKAASKWVDRETKKAGTIQRRKKRRPSEYQKYRPKPMGKGLGAKAPDTQIPTGRLLEGGDNPIKRRKKVKKK